MLHERIHAGNEHLRMPNVTHLLNHKGGAQTVVYERLERGGRGVM